VTDVQRRGRLVEQQHGRFLGQRPGEHGALALATGQAGQPALGEHGQPQPVHGAPGRVPVVAAGAAEVTEVGGAAEQHVLADRHVRREHRFLRHVGDQPGPAGDRPQFGAVQQHVPAVADQPGGGAQQGGLAGAVRSDQAEPAAGPDRAGDPVQDRRPVQRDSQVTHRQRAHVRTDLVDRRIQMNTGEPISAVTTPIGSSAGDRMVRASVSASTRKPAPPIRDSGSTCR
jgi:hypothetical protein